METKPVPAKDLLKWAQANERLSYRIIIGEPPSFSTIDIYDELTGVPFIEIHIRCWVLKDLEIMARHQLRLQRAFQAEIFRHEFYEKSKHQMKLPSEPNYVVKAD
jgi:hypothetical protein